MTSKGDHTIEFLSVRTGSFQVCGKNYEEIDIEDQTDHSMLRKKEGFHLYLEHIYMSQMTLFLVNIIITIILS